MTETSPRRDHRWLLTEAPGLLTLPDATGPTGRDRKTISQMLDEGTLQGVQVGTRRFVLRTSLIELLGLEAAV